MTNCLLDPRRHGPQLAVELLPLPSGARRLLRDEPDPRRPLRRVLQGEGQSNKQVNHHYNLITNSIRMAIF